MAGELEIWAGVECTVNRVGDSYLDQLARNGHAWRAGDLERFARLGVKTLRYPILWERTAPEINAAPDWRWADSRLIPMRDLGIEPIVGLLHHGSGPRHTSLVDPMFPRKLAAYAGAVAERYPWITRYTPINEPLTTARFCGLYGLWYPHGRSQRVFARALYQQIQATLLAMREIRKVQPAARLVQTDDLGTIYSTAGIAYQAEFENERRWLTWDLLTGRVDRHHPLWQHLCDSGVTPAEWETLIEMACPPDVIGINHYVTSDRFLDERLSLYLPLCHGGNGRHCYADVEAARVPQCTPAPIDKLLIETYRRYRIPVAVTEAHLGGPREEQLRWLAEVWQNAQSARRSGADVRAVTIWSLLGSYDWDSLVTCDRGHYEPGVFDVRSGVPRATALAKLTRELTGGLMPAHPVLDTPGWWHRPERYLFGSRRGEAVRGGAREIWITGGTGTLGRAFARICQARGLAYRLLNRSQMDIADEDSVRRALRETRPWAIINAAGYVRVDAAESDRARCFRENARGPAILARACAASGEIRLLTFSSDLVFDGSLLAPYTESSEVAPLNTYGESKAEAEKAVRAAYDKALIIRTSAFFGPWDEYNFVTGAMRNLRRGQAIDAVSDCVVSPTYVPELAHAAIDLLVDGESGVWHLANRGAVSWAELATMAARIAGLNHRLVREQSWRTLAENRAPRPAYSVLGSERSAVLGSLEKALETYFAEMARSGCGVAVG